MLKLWPLLIGAAATALAYRTQFSSRFDLFPGPRGDTRLTAYLVEHWYQALSGHAALLSPSMFYPVQGTLGFTDVFLAYIPVYSLLRGIGYDIFTGLSLTVILFAFLNFVACFVLLNGILKRHLLASAAGAWFFAFNNPNLANSDHLQLHALFLLPVIAGLLVFFFTNAASLATTAACGVLVFAALCVHLELLTSFYLGWFTVFWLALFGGLALFFAPSRSFIVQTMRAQRAAIVAALLVFAAGFIPFMYIYLPALQSTGWYDLLPGYVPEIRSFFLMADGNYVWSRFTAWTLANAADPDWGRRISIGLVPSLAWIAASCWALWLIVVDSKKTRQDTKRRFLALAILATDVLCIIGLQFRGHTLWKVAYLVVPGAKAIRAVARYVVVLALPMTIAFTFALDQAISKVHRVANRARVFAAATLFAVVCFGLLEQMSDWSAQTYSISAENSRLTRLSQKLPDDCSAFYVLASPLSAKAEFGDENSMHDAMLISLIRHVPTLNGRSGKNPPGWSLRYTTAPDYEEKVRNWIDKEHIGGKVCRLELD